MACLAQIDQLHVLQNNLEQDILLFSHCSDLAVVKVSVSKEK